MEKNRLTKTSFVSAMHLVHPESRNRSNLIIMKIINKISKSNINADSFSSITISAATVPATKTTTTTAATKL